MGLSSQYPYYGPLGSGNYNVSLAFFGPLSEASKSIGLNSSTGLVLPNTDYIQKFAEGDLGISDSFIKNMIFKNMNSPLASKNEEIFKQFAKQNKIDVSDISKFKKGNKFVIPKDQIKIPDEFSMTGFKAFEKTTLQSIFETQKPFMEIVEIAIGSVAKAEDVIARVMPFFGDPLTVKSRKPVGNSGAGDSRPKAIGYQGAAETIDKLQKLDSIREQGKTQSNTNTTQSNLVITNPKTNTSGFTSQNWKIVSTVYSTGIFEANVDYTYSYINLPADPKIPDVPKRDLQDKDPYDIYKPKTLIFGIYNSQGVVLDPNEYLKTIGLNGNNKTEEATPFKRADWLLRSPKWKLPEGTIEWPSFGTPNFIWEKNEFFGGISTRVSKQSPGDGYSIKKYNTGDKNVITGNVAIPGDPVIQNFDQVESTNHSNYYNDLINIGLNSSDLSEKDKIKTNADINSRLDIKPQIELSYLYGHTKASIYKNVNEKQAYPDTMKKSYKPYQIFIPEATKDVDLVKLANQKGDKPGMIWIDPEADYDMKVIRIDPVTTIAYKDAKYAPELKTSIRQFVKNRTKFSFSNGATFSLSISKNGADTKVFENITDYTFENWNYENKKIINTNKFTISVWSNLAPKKFSSNYYSWIVNKEPKIIGTSSIFQAPDTYNITKRDGVWYYTSNSENYLVNGINFLGDTKVAVYTESGVIKRWYYIYEQDFTGPNKGISLPKFGIERNILINYEQDKIDSIDKTIPIWRLKVDDRYSNSKIIDPSQVTNNFLTTADLFIKEPDYYGHGSPTDPQTLGIIHRYVLTDLDEESYYIVEGVLKNNNVFSTDQNGNRTDSGRGSGGGDGWYRLPDAIGACGVFIRLLIDIGVKLLPKISKLLAIFENPSKFVTDIMIEKLSKNFEFLSSDAISTFQEAMKLKDQLTSQNIDITNIKQIIDQTRVDAKNLASKVLNESAGKSPVELTEAQKTAKDIQLKAEEKINKLQKVVSKKKEAVKKLKDHFKNSVLSNYVYVDDKSLESIFTLDGSATIPFSLFDTDLTFGLASNMGNIPNKPPLTLIFTDSINKFKNVQYLLDGSKPNTNNSNVSTSVKQEISNLKSPIKSQLTALDKQPPFKNKTLNFNEDVNKVQIKFEDGSVEYIPTDSLQTFVLTNQNKYNFIYVTESLNKTLVDVNSLLQSGTQTNLDKAKEKLDLAKKNFPNNTAIDDKLKELDDKNKYLAKNTQPLIKAILGLTTFPIKVVADILKWLFDFFVSLTNPLTLASKMTEFLSFDWILKFVTPTGILDIFGVKFNPLSLITYAAEAATATGKAGVPQAPGMADLSKYISVGMIPTLPTYTADQYKNLLKGVQPLRLLTIFQMIQKFINGVIDFIWSLFGIEALIKAPHISIVPEDTTNMSPEDIKKVLDGIEPKGATISGTKPNPITGSNTNVVDTLNLAVQGFMYEVKLPDGTTKSFLNRDDLDKFIQDNKDFNYDFTF